MVQLYQKTKCYIKYFILLRFIPSCEKMKRGPGSRRVFKIISSRRNTSQRMSAPHQKPAPRDTKRPRHRTAAHAATQQTDSSALLPSVKSQVFCRNRRPCDARKGRRRERSRQLPYNTRIQGSAADSHAMVHAIHARVGAVSLRRGPAETL